MTSPSQAPLRLVALAAMLTLVGIGLAFAGKPASTTPRADLFLAPLTPPCGGSEVTGIYQDGKGSYLPGDEVIWAKTKDGVDLRVKPLCSAGREINALLPAAAMAQLAGPMTRCQGSGGLNTIQLKIPDLQNAPNGAVVGQPSLASEGYPKDQSVNYYFIAGGAAYNLIWQSGIHLTRSGNVYDLSTDLTSSNADLVQGSTYLGTYCVPLKLIVTN